MSKVAFIFPGQGTQFVGMGKDLYEKNGTAKNFFDNVLSPELKDIMFNGPEETLKLTKNTQPAVVALSIILYKLLSEKGIKPDYVAGHSLGEYSALGAAGVLSDTEIVRLASIRGEIMSVVAERVGGTMAAVLGLPSDKIESICNSVDGIVEAVNFNEPTQTVIAGTKEAIELVSEKLKEAGAKRVIGLPVSGPFHSSLMMPAGEELREFFKEFSFKNAKVDIVCNTDVIARRHAEEIKEELYQQTFGPVRWVETINKLKDEGVTTFYEIGPGKVLAGLVKKIDKTLTVINIEKIEDIENL